MHSVARVFAVAALAAVSLTCADQSTGLRARLALLSIAPTFAQAPAGGPDIDVERVRGVLLTATGTDSAVAEANVQGDSAILEFLRVVVTGDSTNYLLRVTAFDSNDVGVFSAFDTIAVRAGDNPPHTPEMRYIAPDTTAATVEIQIAGVSASSTNLSWLGAKPGNTTCLNRVPNASAVTQVQLSAVGRTSANALVPSVRVGWTAVDETAASVTDGGLVVAKCSNKSTQVIARSFLNHADTITVNVTAPPFSLLMNPETATLARGATQQLTAMVVDENGNTSTATGVTWNSSDPAKATVSATGVVTAIRNGRVQISASASNRTTVGIIDVVRPQAASVKVIPLRDTLGVGMVRRFVARALDAANNIIADASEFVWSSSNTSKVTINSSTGVAAAVAADTGVNLVATIDGKSGSGKMTVVSTLPPGTIAGIVRDGATDAVVAGATVAGKSTNVTTDAGGRFSLTGVRQGDTITVSKTGYVTIKFLDAPAFPNQTITIDEIPLPPTSASNGTLQGKVINALTGSAVSGVTVSLYADLNSAPSILRPNATAVATATTNSDGLYSFSRPAGAYTLLAKATGYGEGLGIAAVIGGATSTALDIILPPALPNNSGLFVVLTWGHGGAGVPADLDLHMTGPAPTSATDTTTRFQIYSGNRTRVTGIDTIATIDAVRSTGPGPEVASLRPAAPPGLYRFYVKNISDATNASSTQLSMSADARITVMQGSAVIATFFPPPNQMGTVWEAFAFDGARLIPVGQITQPANPTVLPSVIPETPNPALTTRRRR